MFPEYLKISADHLGKGQPVKVRVKGGLAAVAQDLAEAILTEARAEAGRILRDGASAPAVQIETGPARQAPPAQPVSSSAKDDRLDLDLEVSLSDLFGDLG